MSATLMHCGQFPTCIRLDIIGQEKPTYAPGKDCPCVPKRDPWRSPCGLCEGHHDCRTPAQCYPEEHPAARGCACEPAGSDGLACPDPLTGRLLCADDEHPAADALLWDEDNKETP